ncbi:hypothetical protein LPB140_01850 [Sphingorhabdus lutea]|uniref:Thioredoxin domain-containing protein n=1 Tax=Sphingorhabdus lutea TaxID=1913578 RepID=A0A1L3J9I0_9SPHN|nr:thioredoxin family protein [Sphingorhabdus lutea]APG61778.1 hypothetical protein LPB140_01850 [Sphingorhabdus lutea]
MMQRKFILFLILGFLLFIPQMHLGAWAKQNNISAQLVAEEAPNNGSASSYIALVMKPENGWHGYWKNPGEAGQGIELIWKTKDGAAANFVGAPLFPVPHAKRYFDLMNHVYLGEYAILFPIKNSTSLTQADLKNLQLSASWLACTDRICVPERGEFQIETTNGAIKTVSKSTFDNMRQKLPQISDSMGNYQINGNMVRLSFPIPAQMQIDAPYFFAADQQNIDLGARQKWSRSNNALIMETNLSASHNLGGKNILAGLLKIGAHQGLEIKAGPGQVAANGAPISGEADDKNADAAMTPQPIILIIFAAILGGLLLNLLPCLFPIIGLKAISISKYGDNGKAKPEAWAYIAGTMFSCIIMGAILLGLRASGEMVGWAFQLQQPRFVLLLTLLMVAICANLWGWFHLPQMGGKLQSALPQGTAGSFGTGILAAIIGAPCTGPFMAAALGAALTLPPLSAMLIFAGLGFGLGLPFLAIAYSPWLRGKIPPSGPWMETFRRIMTIPMAITAILLMWLLWRLSGQSGLVIALVASVLLLIILNIFGHMQAKGPVRKTLYLPQLAGIFIGSVLVLPPAPISRADHQAQSYIKTIPFNADNLSKLRAEKKPIFLYFTADWCISCKVNEKRIIAQKETADIFEKSGIIVMVGDFTRNDPNIARFIEQQGRTGVPLYLFYDRNGHKQILPQILSMDDMQNMATAAGK